MHLVASGNKIWSKVIDILFKAGYGFFQALESTYFLFLCIFRHETLFSFASCMICSYQPFGKSKSFQTALQYFWVAPAQENQRIIGW